MLWNHSRKCDRFIFHDLAQLLEWSALFMICFLYNMGLRSCHFLLYRNLSFNPPAGAHWCHHCIEPCVIRSGRLTFVCFSFIRSREHTNGCLFNLHYFFPSQCNSVVLLSHRARTSNVWSLNFLSCTCHGTILPSCGCKRDVGVFFCNNYLPKLANTAMLGYCYVHEKYQPYSEWPSI